MSEFASARLTAHELNKIVVKLGGHAGALRFLRGESSVPEPTHPWREVQGGVISLSVISDGTTGEDWVKRLESNGFRVGKRAMQALRSPDFKPTTGVTTEVAVLKGILFEDSDRITKKIRAEATRRGLGMPNPEVVCLMREKFMYEEMKQMGLWCIVAMHNPVKSSRGDPYLLVAHHGSDGRSLIACSPEPNRRWLRDNGFAFAVPQ